MNIDNGFLVQKQRKTIQMKNSNLMKSIRNYILRSLGQNGISFAPFYTQFGWHFCYFYSVCRVRVESESTEKNGLFMRRF